jgi:predicted DNA-binding transcriptional regulator YafY
MLRVLQLIQSRGRYGVKDVATELECSERTVFRDLAVLELAGVPWYFDKLDNCYRLRPGFQFPVINLSDDDLIGQATALAVTAAPGLNVNGGARPATRKLQTSSSGRAAQLLADVERVTSVLNLKLADHSRHHEVIKTAQWALIQGRRLVGMYASPYEPKPKRLELHPYRLCMVNQAWYLIARPESSDAPKTYRIARFNDLRPIDELANVPADFDLRAYFGNAWAVYRGELSYNVEILVASEAAAIITETVWHHTQAVQHHRDRSVTLRFQIDGLNEIVHWVLAWSGKVRVVQPAELRDLVVEQLRRALTLNETDPA